jgi:dihydroneopterin aldolase
MDRVRIEGLAAECVVGIYPRERVKPQPLRVDVEMRLDLERAAIDERVRHTVDYDFMSSQLVFLLQACRFGMLETAAHVIARYLLAPPGPSERRAPIEGVTVRLTKPDALAGRAVPSIEIRRERAWCVTEVEEKPFGTVDVIHEKQDAGIYRLNVRPGGTIPLHLHRVMTESEMVLTSGLLCQREPAPKGTVFRWPKGAAHVYENPTDRWQSILCVDEPRFIESDEIPTEGEPDIIPSEHFGGGG